MVECYVGSKHTRGGELGDFRYIKMFPENQLTWFLYTFLTKMIWMHYTIFLKIKCEKYVLKIFQ